MSNQAIRYVVETSDTSLCYTYNTYKVMDQREAALEENPNPFAIVAWAVLTALKRKRITSQELYSLKLSIARRLVMKSIDKVKIGKIMDFLRYYVRFENPEMGAKFDKEIAVITKNTDSMGTREFILNRAEKEGIQKGVQKGKKELMEEQVTNNLIKNQLSPEQIAEILGAPMALVLAIKKELEGGE